MMKYPQIVDKINRVFKGVTPRQAPMARAYCNLLIVRSIVDVPVRQSNSAIANCLNMQLEQVRTKLMRYVETLYCNNMR